MYALLDKTFDEYKLESASVESYCFKNLNDALKQAKSDIQLTVEQADADMTIEPVYSEYETASGARKKDIVGYSAVNTQLNETVEMVTVEYLYKER